MATVQVSQWPLRSLHESPPAYEPAGGRPEPAEVWNPLSAVKDRIGVILVVLLIFSIVLATAGFVASYDGRRQMAAFASDGRPAIGTITNKYTRGADQEYWSKVFNGAGQVQLVDFCFRMQDKEYHCGTVTVPARTYDGLRVGSLLKVTYVPWRPDWFYVGDNVPDDPDSAIFTRMFQVCTMSGLLLIIAIAAMVFWQGGDSMAGQTAGASEASDVAFRFRQRRGYGKHRSPG